MRAKILAITLLLLAAPVWGQVASRSCVSGESDYITWGDNNTFSFGNGTTDEPFTMAMWVYSADWDADQAFVFAKYDVGTADVEYQFSVGSGGDYNLSLFDGDAANKRRRYAAGELAAGYDGAWVFLAGTYDGNESDPPAGIDLYVNGVVVDDTTDNTGTYTSMDNTTAPMVTCAVSDPTAHKTQIIAYGHLYSRALSASEINQLMHCPGSVTSGLVGYWPLTDSTTQYDQSANSNNGTNNGTAASTDGPPVSTNCAAAGGN